MPLNRAAFRRSLLTWYDASNRLLPWRLNTDFYRVWVSEIMLQQTRVQAVIPYFERFLLRFPDIAALAAAEEEDVLTVWSGLGYYSRARNLHRAAKQLTLAGQPRTHGELLEMPGVGPYTAAAIGSIALQLPNAAVDGNVLRVVSRLQNDPSPISTPAVQRAFNEFAQNLLDPVRPGDFNQAMMELGATVCLPRNPGCGVCPVQGFCAAFRQGTQNNLPVKPGKAAPNECRLDLLLLTRSEPDDACFLMQRGAGERRLAGFWELPEKKLVPKLRARVSKTFVHQIVQDRFQVTVWTARTPVELPEGRWFTAEELKSIPLATTSRKAICAVNALKF